MATNANTIILKGKGRYEEGPAAAALTPGHLLMETSAGKVQKHNSAGGRAERAFALEDALQGKTINDAFAINDPVPYVLAQPGDEVFAFIKATTVVARGAALVSAGDGTLYTLAAAITALVTSTDGTAAAAADLAALKVEAEKIGDDVRLIAARNGISIIAYAREAIDLSGGGAVDTRIAVRVV